MPIKSFLNIFNKRTSLAIMLCVFLNLSLWNSGSVNAADQGLPSPKVLVVYSTETGEVTAPIRALDLVLGHFSSNISLISDKELTREKLQDVTQLVYYGEVEKTIPQESQSIMSEFQGAFLAVGKNVEQLGERFSFLSLGGQVSISMVSKFGSSSQELLEQNYLIEKVNSRSGETILTGWNGENSYPLMVKRGETAYFSTTEMYAPFNLFLGEGLHSFFHQVHDEGNIAYIRLEDVHPASDPKLLKEIGNYLADKGIPFMIALIPVYTNSETLQMQHLKDNPELVQVLQDLQSKGASIVLHGYSHQYRTSETGEGFEFWDVINNIPISGPPDEKIEIKQRFEFANQSEYETYKAGLKSFDETYTRTRIEKGIQELKEIGIIPLGFEAPHYTMSQQGYKVVSEYFRFVLGQAQLGDQDWEQMSSSPFISTPAFLHGLTILPETVGYYDPTSPTSLTDMITKIKQMQFVQDGMIGLFYHPYLGVDHIKEIVSYMETIPNLRWMDLRQLNGMEPIPAISVDRNLKGNQSVMDISSVLPNSPGLGTVEKILWGIVGLVAIMVILFLLYTLRNRLNLRKQLFQERNVNG